MRANAPRRIMAFLFDFFVIIFILTLLFRLFGDNLVKNQFGDYDHIYNSYQENLDDYNLRYDTLFISYEDDFLTLEEFDAADKLMYDDFRNNNEYYINSITLYYFNSALFFLFGYVILDYTHNLVTKGKTLGRRSMKIELAGRITWYTLFLREVMFKTLFWLVTLSAGIAIDFALIAFTSKKKTLRDYLSETYVVYSGARYPF
ncbi:MAG: RDD family protein [Candidatus Izemoplasma sp.]